MKIANKKFYFIKHISHNLRVHEYKLFFSIIMINNKLLVSASPNKKKKQILNAASRLWISKRKLIKFILIFFFLIELEMIILHGKDYKDRKIDKFFYI